MTDRKKKPEAIGNIVANLLGQSGLAERVDQAGDHPGMAEAGRSADREGDVAEVDHGERNAVRAGDDERVDERAVAARAGAVAFAECGARNGRRFDGFAGCWPR